MSIDMNKYKILLVCPFEDNQSGTYIHDTFIKMDNLVAMFDWRLITKQKGIERMNQELIEVVDELKPDMTFIVKGTGITADTIVKMRQQHMHNIVGWIFDVTLGGTFVKDVPEYTTMLAELDTFYTMDEDAVPELRKLGINAEWLPQACYPTMHGEQILNSIQKRKYGADIVFMGSVGSIHPNREALLSRLDEEGFDFKIYGEVLYPKDTEPDWVKDHHTGYGVKNQMHSTVCNSSKIVLGMDGWPHRSKSYSLRLYKVLCAGGFYLTTHTKNIEQAFKPGVHLDTYKNADDMIEKIIYYLNNDDERTKIAQQGQQEVLAKHQFKDRFEKILKK
jgi:spore maturation protein CgeB